MRIQHNIAALNSYRQLSGNNNALSKNLEKLSSGYKINRAGDDAAGLAISEKMRAQIKGLEAAQKNANDGISLVQTAEGALTEVHSMLNRMVYLATQSANGTYDNDVDRANLQEEVNSLLEEIDRISQSTNFNGLNLLDGSMDSNGSVTSGGEKTNVAILPDKATDPTTQVGTKTVLHAGETEAKKTSFEVYLHNSAVTGKEGDKLKVSIGSKELELDFKDAPDAAAGELQAGTELDAKAIADAIKAKFEADGGDIDGVAFTVTTTADNGGTIKFEQTNDPAKGDTIVNADLPVRVEIVPEAGGTNYVPTGLTVTDPDAATVTPTAGVTGTTNASYAFDLDGFDVDKAGTVTFTIGGKDFDIEITEAEVNDKAANPLDELVAGKLATAMNADKFTDADAGDFTAAATGSAITLTSANQEAVADAALNTALSADIAVAEKAGETTEQKGTLNVSTGNNQTGVAPADGTLASTKFTLTEDIVSDGTTLTIGETTYTFKVGADSKVSGDNVIDLSAFEAGDAGLLKAAGELISQKDNTMFTVGYNDTDKTISIHEKNDNTTKVDDLKTVEGFDALVYTNAASETKAGAALSLQVGDTADEFNKVKLDIKDMSTEGLNIKGISIADQDSASEAVKKIKDAINTVSSQRGALGAIQNRLEHTINNLGVQTENITAAESRIRDTDMAEEMMAYTKNNILVQAAQAMLAQANQVPQGVLQLLQ